MMQTAPVRLKASTRAHGVLKRPLGPVGLLRGPFRGPAVRIRAEPEAAPAAAAAVSGSESDGDKVPEGCSRYTVELSRPLGLVLEEKTSGEIFVGEVSQGGQAALQGTVAAGDLLISVTGVAYTKESNYQGAVVRSGETRVTLNVRNEKFDTVMAAIGSHKAGQLVQLTFQRC